MHDVQAHPEKEKEINVLLKPPEHGLGISMEQI